MTAEEWEKTRQRVINATFQTGRPVFADSDGALRFADGAKEPLPDEVGQSQAPSAGATEIRRAARSSYWAMVISVVAAILNAVAGVWLPWHFIAAALCAGSALLWHRARRRQLALLGAGR